LILAQVSISPESGISIALLITIVIATWKLATTLTEIRKDLAEIKKASRASRKRDANQTAHIQHIENRIDTVADDVNNLAGFIRAPEEQKAALLDIIRSNRSKPFVPPISETDPDEDY
jgi:cob(I)alamin adenosyltransferase